VSVFAHTLTEERANTRDAVVVPNMQRRSLGRERCQLSFKVCQSLGISLAGALHFTS